jgi:hypothetical protein
MKNIKYKNSLPAFRQLMHKEGNHEKGWPVNFFKQTYGCLKKYPLTRPDQGRYA